SGAIRLGRCSTSGQLVSTASATPARITHRISARPSLGEDAQRLPPTPAPGSCCSAACPPGAASGPPAGEPSPGAAESPRGAAGPSPGVSGVPVGGREGLGTPVLIVCSCSGPQGSAQHTGAACAI